MVIIKLPLLKHTIPIQVERELRSWHSCAKEGAVNSNSKARTEGFMFKSFMWQDSPLPWTASARSDRLQRGAVPAKRIREVGPDLSRNEIERIAGNYLKYAGWFKEG